ncbi:L domain-like protein kinase superfamily [Klebsormidium nitens]|uniref:L domain-like protein kinase superfamily n=1 Tax=Klebsormidium nitens TaxID=105231 RepID=A0A1Y1ID63_KLENI|nr:L domain-like protein kinase superfamily [Klebsormidium nitens]|eukprot:GAQ87379.1 L domain-like protein kinase superfamily [Klebsormidium nitens]
MEVRASRKALLISIAVCNTWMCVQGYSSDVDALLEVKDAMGGPSRAFVSWDPDTDPCNTTWLGVRCTRDRVTSLVLDNQTLDGTVSPSIAALTELTTLVLNYNRLGGVVPDMFGNMTNLRFLDLSQNRFGGRIPPSLGNASNLIAIVLSSNNFNQSIPTSFASLTKLQSLNVSSNDLHGAFFAPLVTLPAVRILDLSTNSINGTLPNVNVSSSLTLLNVENNRLSGTIPRAYVSDGLTLRFSGNSNLRLPASLAPAPAPVPKPPPPPPPEVATSPAPESSTSPAPAPQPPAVSIPAATPPIVTATPKPAVTLNPTVNSVVATPQSANQSSTAGKDGGGSNTGVIVGSSVGVALAAGVIVAALLALLALRRRRRAGAESAAYLPTTTKDTWQPFPDTRPVTRGYGGARIYPLPMLMRGTHGFADSQQVGTSPGNKVYLATLPESDPLLVKRRDPAIAGFQSKSEFEKEVEELGRLNHRNLVPLAGCCDDDKERILIFAAPATTTLRDHLRPDSVNTPAQSPDWAARLEIASGIVGALAYLHSKSSPERLYEELASTSVILDDSLWPRLADFHLEGGADPESPLSSSGRSLPRTPSGGRRQGGSDGGCSGGPKSVHADVYNFGMILLELLAGRPLFLAGVPVDKRNLASWVPPLLSVRDYDSFLDPQLAGDCTELSLSGLCDLAQDCISDQEMVRPSLPEIQRRLARCVSLQNRNDRTESGFRPSPRVGFSKEKGWEEEDEYEVRDLPDGVPIGQGLGRAAWDAVGPSSGGTSDAGSTR